MDAILFSAKPSMVNIDEELSKRVKPEKWIKEWQENKNSIRSKKNVFVITQIEPFSYDTYQFRKYDGSYVTKAPQNYIRVLQP